MSQKIVLIDSDVSFSAELRSGLEVAGFEVIEVADGKVAMDRLREVRPDVIFLSVELMAGQSGYILCGRVKKDEVLGHIPLILGAHDTSGFEQHQRLKARADAYLQKPFGVDTLLQTISQLQMVAGAFSAPQGEATATAQDREVELLFQNAFDQSDFDEGAALSAASSVGEAILLDPEEVLGEAVSEEVQLSLDEQDILEAAPIVESVESEEADALIAAEPFLEAEEILAAEPLGAEAIAEGAPALMDSAPILEAELLPAEEAEPILESEEVLELDPIEEDEPQIELLPEVEAEDAVSADAPADIMSEGAQRSAPGLDEVALAPAVAEGLPSAEALPGGEVALLSGLEGAAGECLAALSTPTSMPDTAAADFSADFSFEEAVPLQPVPILHFPEADALSAASCAEESAAAAPALPAEGVDAAPMQARLESAEAEAKRLEAELAQVSQELQLAQAQQGTASAEDVDALCAERDALQRDLAAAQADLSVLRPECGQAKIDLDAARAELDLMRAERDAGSADRDALRGDLDAARLELDAAKADLGAARAELASVQASRDNAEARACALAAEKEALQGQVEDLEANLALSEERAGKNYLKLRNDERLRAKARKALDVALVLLAAAERVPIEPLPGEQEQGDLAVKALDGLVADASVPPADDNAPPEAESA